MVSSDISIDSYFLSLDFFFGSFFSADVVR